MNVNQRKENTGIHRQLLVTKEHGLKDIKCKHEKLAYSTSLGSKNRQFPIFEVRVGNCIFNF